MFGKEFILFILILIGAFFLWRWYRKFKVPKTNSLVMVTGGVKSGKSTFSVNLAITTYKRNLRKVKFMNFIAKIFNKPQAELPLLYSNVPLGVPYVELTRDLLLMKTRFAYKSVCYIQEASLFADSQLIKDKNLNNSLLVFFKLFAHITKGGVCVLDSQQIQDCHYACKRSLSNYFYIHHLKKFPFFLIAYVRELMYSEDGSVINSVDKDLEEDLKKVLIWKSVWKKFDCYCLSTLTEDKPKYDKVIKSSVKSDLKCYKIVSFRDEFNINIPKNLKGGKVNERKDTKEVIQTKSD